MRDTLTEQSIAKNTKNTRDTNVTIHNKKKLRMNATLTEQSIKKKKQRMRKTLTEQSMTREN